jgi:hypothetical protein
LITARQDQQRLRIEAEKTDANRLKQEEEALIRIEAEEA